MSIILARDSPVPSCRHARLANRAASVPQERSSVSMLGGAVLSAVFQEVEVTRCPGTSALTTKWLVLMTTPLCDWVNSCT